MLPQPSRVVPPRIHGGDPAQFPRVSEKQQRASFDYLQLARCCATFNSTNGGRKPSNPVPTSTACIVGKPVSEWCNSSRIISYYDPANYESDLNAPLEMLEVNNSLEYLEVIIPTMHRTFISKFEQHDKTPTDRADELSLETKLAFLSVVERCKSMRPTKERCDAPVTSSALCKLDQLALSKIFAFSVPPVLRQVVCRSVRKFEIPRN